MGNPDFLQKGYTYHRPLVSVHAFNSDDSSSKSTCSFFFRMLVENTKRKENRSRVYFNVYFSSSGGNAILQRLFVEQVFTDIFILMSKRAYPDAGDDVPEGFYQRKSISFGHFS